MRADRPDGKTFDVEPEVTSGDYLQGFLRGTRKALFENERDSVTISIPKVSAYELGALIALYERAVGFYGSLVNINAYHQPGVEAGKKAATELLKLQDQIVAKLKGSAGQAFKAADLAGELQAGAEDVFHILVHLSANSPRLTKIGTGAPGETAFSWLS